MVLNTAAMNGMMDVLITNFYVVMVGQIEILKEDFKQLAETTFIRNFSQYSAVKEENKERIFYQRKRTSIILPGKIIYYEGDALQAVLLERIKKCTTHYDAILT